MGYLLNGHGQKRSTLTYAKRQRFGVAMRTPPNNVWASLVVLLFVAGTGLIALLVLGAMLWGQMVPSQGQIAFLTSDRQWKEIHAIDLNTQIIRPIFSLMNLDQMTWSASGGLAFTIRRGENSRIAVIDPQFQNMRLLTYNTGFDNNPAWSPDGQWLAFQSSNVEGVDIYVIDSTGNNQRRLTDDPAFDGEPTWSPDGKQIAFRSSRNGNSDLYIMDGDGGNVRQLTNSLARDEHPVWSPDGNYIAFASYVSANWDLFLLELDTGGIRRLVESPARDFSPSWSPDGEHIAFESNRDGQPSIYVLNLKADLVTLLTEGSQGTYFQIGQR